jgi:aspartate-semialdehyde dehydrogenase
LRLWASTRSAWKKMETPFWNIEILEVNEVFFEWLDFALFSAWWDISKIWASVANKKWVIVIDNSSAFRYENDVPLIIPQINAKSIWTAKLIANPNCTTAIALMAVYPIYQKYWIKKMIVSTYQATSWAWAKWMQELLENSKKYLSWEDPTIEVFNRDIAFNLIPHIDKFQENGYTKEEMKVSWETQKIFWDNSLLISTTAVRIPTLRAHSESIVLETKEKVDIEDIKQLLNNSPWVKLVDNIEKNEYPTPRSATWNYDVEVGRIRKNLVFWDYWIEFFVSWDQLLRWAALNAVEILKYIIENKI